MTPTFRQFYAGSQSQLIASCSGLVYLSGRHGLARRDWAGRGLVWRGEARSGVARRGLEGEPAGVLNVRPAAAHTKYDHPMDTNQLQALINRKPFRPFQIATTAGDHFAVLEEGDIFNNRRRPNLYFIFTDDGLAHWIEADDIVSVTTL